MMKRINDLLPKYINALRKCAKEHENDFVPTFNIRVTDLCNDTAKLLEELEQELYIPISVLKDIKAEIANISEKSSICDDIYCYGYRDKLASDYKTEVLEVIDNNLQKLSK